ncbi:hypothetical protein C2G38_2196680 [Gigaspora rosea]|uniref:Uncharacterized protein n=1 Tax=Gigaspora rosea TaxID=44941 RepID=A0A397UUE6_9GLOM|nr:hypothetical protein C2G38_2196680 [Gigaspora rosea]
MIKNTKELIELTENVKNHRRTYRKNHEETKTAKQQNHPLKNDEKNDEKPQKCLLNPLKTMKNHRRTHRKNLPKIDKKNLLKNYKPPVRTTEKEAPMTALVTTLTTTPVTKPATTPVTTLVTTRKTTKRKNTARAQGHSFTECLVSIEPKAVITEIELKKRTHLSKASQQKSGKLPSEEVVASFVKFLQLGVLPTRSFGIFKISTMWAFWFTPSKRSAVFTLSKSETPTGLVSTS